MDRRASHLLAGVAVFALGGLDYAPNVQGQVEPPYLAKARQVASRVASGFEKYEYSQGAAEAAARPTSRKAWAAAFKIPGQSNVAAAGFTLPPVSVGGTIPSARVKATINVLQVVGSALTLVLQVERSGVPGGQIKASAALTAPGSVTLATESFSLQEGGQYRAKAFVNAWAGSTEGDMCAAVITISEIKWEF